MKGRGREPANEKWPVYWLMMLTGGYFGGYTYTVRGGVFCNAQTGNVLLLAMALGSGDWRKGCYYLVPITAYCLGAVVSEAAGQRAGKGRRGLRWEAVLVIIEMAVVVVLGFLPEEAPVQITQVTVNFIASMQYNTFRKTQGVTVATTFCTNHIRQLGVALCHLLTHEGEQEKNETELWVHIGMLAAFVVGGAVSTALCGAYLGRAVWFAELPLAGALAYLLRAGDASDT